ncbi:hypothetical protein [Candidatus Chlorohelix sp.]|uniref:hypothetical protein n=1 Tax=Candidatus Chlorohelix sp. TaxID=3139201 RepID=UPI00302CBB34
MTRYNWVVALLSYTLLSIIITFPFVFRLNDSMLGPSFEGDMLYSSWQLWWFQHALSTGQDPNYTNYLFALLPQVVVFIQLYTNMVLGLFFMCFMSPFGAINLTIFLGFVFSGFTMYLLAAEFVPNKLACFVAGFLFDFCTYHFYRAEFHLGLATLYALPFMVWRIFIFYKKPTLKNALLASLGLSFLILTDFYLTAYFLLLFALLFLLGKVLSDFKWFKIKNNLLLSGLVLIITVAICFLPLSVYLKIDPSLQTAFKEVSQGTTYALSADLLSFFVPDQTNFLFGNKTSNIYHNFSSEEISSYLGFVALILGIGAFLPRLNRHKNALFWLVFGFSGLLLSLGPALQVNGVAYRDLPFYNWIYGWSALSFFRAPNRMAIVPMFALSLLSAYSLNSLFLWLAKKRAPLYFASMLAALVMSLSLVEHLPYSFPFPTTEIPNPALYQIMAEDKEPGKVLDLPVYPYAKYQYYQTLHHRPIVTGYLSRITIQAWDSVETLPNLPQLYSDKWYSFPDLIQREIYPVEEGFKDGLQQNNIRYVVLHRNNGEAIYPKLHEFLLEKLGAPFYDNNQEGLDAWRIEPSVPPSPEKFRFRLVSGWAYGEMTLKDGVVERPVLQSGILSLYSPNEITRSMSIQIRPFDEPKTIQVLLNGAVVATVKAEQPLHLYTIDLKNLPLQKGDNSLEIVSLDACHIYNNGVCRSFGVRNVQFTDSLALTPLLHKW